MAPKLKHEVDPCVGTVLSTYLREHVDTSVVAYQRQYNCDKPLRNFFGSMKPRDVTMTHTLAYYNKRRAGLIAHVPTKVGDATIRREIGMLRAAINYGIKCGNLPPDSLRHMFTPPPPPPKSLFLTKEQLDMVLGEAREMGGHICTFVMIAAYTASRRGAIQNLEWSRVNMANRSINFDDGSRKTKKRRVTVPMCDALFSFMVMHRALNPDDTDVIRGRPDMGRRFKTLCERLCVRHPEHKDVWRAMTAHTLRHTWASLAAQSGVSMFDIAGVLGDSVQTVISVYAHQSPSHLRSAVSFL